MVDEQEQTAERTRRLNPLRRLRAAVAHVAVRCGTAVYAALLRRAGPKRRRRLSKPVRILLTGRFDSDNWIRAHIGPLAASNACQGVWMVSTQPVPDLPKVTGVYPPRWLVRLIGATPARLVTFTRYARRHRPEVVGGFHLLINGLVAILVARRIGARSMYFCVGGPVEVLDGGVWGEGNYFSMMETPDAIVERRLLEAVRACDLVVTMGSRAAAFFRERGVAGDVRVISGGIDPTRFQANGAVRDIDVILTARLVPIKRVDVWLDALNSARARMGDLAAVIVGSGPLQTHLQRACRRMGLAECVRFIGYQQDVASWLARSRLFVLTSDSEGLSLALMEAMTAGLTPIVSNVGDLADLVSDGVNGYLVPRRRPDLVADRIVELLTNPTKLEAFATAARWTARRYEISQTVGLWNGVLAQLSAR